MTDSDRDMAFSVSESGEFLAEYTAWLWGCGATAIRIEKKRRADSPGARI